MNRHKSLILILTLWISLTMCPQVECGQNGKEEAGVTIELMKLDVNDTNLDLNYKIKNISDHDVWVCASLSPEYPSVYEYFLDKDGKTLVLRRRSDLPIRILLAMKYPTLRSRYVRLPPGQEKAESISLAVPVSPSVVYIGERANAEFASRLVIEIGFYNEDVLERIRSIIEVAERFHCASVEFTDFESDIMRCYFKGLLITKFFGGLSHFDESHKDVSEQFITACTDQLLGEQVLRITVDRVSIPYEGFDK